MIEEFTFHWNEKNWSAYFNGLIRDRIVVHFADRELRDLFGEPLVYSKGDSNQREVRLNKEFPSPHNGVLTIIQDSIEDKIGMSLQDFLVIEE